MKLALGTVQFGLNYGIANHQGPVSENEAKAILKHAKASGMDTLDTAISYGDSEYRLGQFGISEWKVVTKLPSIPEECRDIASWVPLVVKESIQRLKVTSLYGVLLHRPYQLLEKEGGLLYSALEQLKYDGLVQKIGISIYDPEELNTLYDHYKFDLIQAPFNILDRRLLDTGWIYRLTDLGTELHVRSIFLQGLLLMRNCDRPNEFNRWASIWSEYDNWLMQISMTPLQACVRYVLSFPEISKVIVGVDSLDQLMAILLAAEGPAPLISDFIKTDDPDLLNPARWATLT